MVSPSYIPPPPPPPRRKQYCCAYCGTKWTQEQCRNCGASERKEIKEKFIRPIFPSNQIKKEGDIGSFVLGILALGCLVGGIGTILILLAK